MSATPATSSSCCTPAAENGTAGIDASCRLPLFVLFGGAAFWLVVSSAFGLLATMTFHKPTMFADCAMSSYGRAFPVWSNALVYGFCIPSGIGVGLWLLARLGRTTLAQPFLIALAAKLWHVGVLCGLVGILRGNSTGFEWLEMPRQAQVILLVAFTVIAVLALVTHQNREERGLYPSQWFVLAAFFWFPWIFSTAHLLLLEFPVRGIVQSSIAWWFSGNLLNVWLALAGLASTFYILPKLVGRPLQSGHIALFVFWTLILFGSWTGIPASAPLPAWMTALSGAAGVLALVPALGVATIVLLTRRGTKTQCMGGPLCFTLAGAWTLVLASLLRAASSIPEVSRVTDFTWFNAGRTDLLIYGFFAMTMFGAVYHILPCVAGVGLFCQKPVKFHFWAAGLGTLLLALPLVVGGISQGLKLANPGVSMIQIAKSSLMAIRASSTGEALILLGSFLFLFNVGAVIVRFYLAACKKIRADVTAEIKCTEVRA